MNKLKDFNLFYKYIRESHSRVYGERIFAQNSAEAFKLAIKIMKRNKMNPDNFDTFYVSPVNPRMNKKYTLQLHGWNTHGDFPRPSWGVR